MDAIRLLLDEDDDGPCPRSKELTTMTTTEASHERKTTPHRRRRGRTPPPVHSRGRFLRRGTRTTGNTPDFISIFCLYGIFLDIHVSLLFRELDAWYYRPYFQKMEINPAVAATEKERSGVSSSTSRLTLEKVPPPQPVASTVDIWNGKFIREHKGEGFIEIFSLC